MTEKAEIATRQAKDPTPIAMGEMGLSLTSLEDAYRFAQYVVKARLCPKDDTPETVLMKLQGGRELGLPPMRAMSALFVVNGRLAMEGWAVLALCRASGKFSKLRPFNDGEGDARAGCVEFIRSDTGETDVVRFTLADAKRAGLMSKDTYKSYPDDMLIWKAVGRFGKRYAADVMMGIEVNEIAKDHRPIVVLDTNAEPRMELPPADETPDPVFDVDPQMKEESDVNA
jgi:hypothetical protein